MRIRESVALVTGGASGLGLATTEMLLGMGAAVVVFDRFPFEGPPGDRAASVQGDVTSEEDVQRAVRIAAERFGGLTCGVHCAGVAAAMLTLDPRGSLSIETFRQLVSINLFGTFNVVRALATQMTKNAPNEDGERGVIVMTASVAAFDGQAGQVAYAASKGGVVSMTLPFARDLAPRGIRVATIAPGVFETPMGSMLPARQRSVLVEATPFPRRFGRVHEFALLVRQIIENPMINGETIRLDGGLRMPAR